MLKMIIGVGAAGCLLGAVSARAAEVEISVGDAIGAYGALQQLDGYKEVIVEAGVKKAVEVPYKLSGVVRMAIARDIIVLKGVVEQFQIARQSKLKEGGTSSPEVVGEVEKMLEVKEKLELTKLSDRDLGLSEGNPIPPSVLGRLGPLLDSSGAIATNSGASR